MTLDATAKESNLKSSLTKYFVDTLETAGGYHLMFDTGLSTPDLSRKKVDRWFVVAIGDSQVSGLSSVNLDIFCCTRRDPEGVSLSAMSDVAFDAVTDTAQPDGRRRIVLYDNLSSSVGALLVQKIIKSKEMEGPEGTKFKILTCNLQWVAKA